MKISRQSWLAKGAVLLGVSLIPVIGVGPDALFAAENGSGASDSPYT